MRPITRVDDELIIAHSTMGSVREKSQLVKTYEKALGTKVNLNPSHDQNFYNKLFEELSNHS